MNLLDSALSYLRSGLCVLPARVATKHPTLAEWKPYRRQRPTEAQLRAWFGSADALCLLTGSASGQLEVLDFDCAGDRFAAWSQLIQEYLPEVWPTLAIVCTPSGGYHVLYQLQTSVPGSTKLASRDVEASSADEVVLYGKRYKPRKKNERWVVTLVLIETRGEGGLVLSAPSPGYALQSGSIDNLPILTQAQRDILVDAARCLNEVLSEPETVALPPAEDQGRPGDDYNQRGDVRALLIKNGWRLSRSGDNEHWCRPGKEQGTSATLKDGVFYVFSSNAAPFEPEKAYAPFSVYALLEHGGDYAKAAATLRGDGFGKEPDTHGVDLSRFLLPKPEVAALDYLTPKALFGYDTSDDPNTLLGTRWLCRGGACLLVGQTGIGKSSFSMQAAISWALGEPLFGIAPTRPLKSLVIQAENDKGDLAEMFRGVVHGMDLAAQLDVLESQMAFYTETARSGASFQPYARALIEKHKPDLVWIDPLFAYIGGSISDQEVVSPFLRNGLGAMAQETGVAWIIVHHTNKPPRDPAQRSGFLSGDYAYLGAGSAELANWARAVLTLREVDDSLYELRASKRGRRAGLVDVDGEFVTEVFLQHGSKGICWERSARPEDEREEIESDDADEVIAAMERGKQYDRLSLRQLAMDTLGLTRSNFTTAGKRGYRVLQIVYSRTRNPQMPAFFTVTSDTQAKVSLDASDDSNLNQEN